MKKDKKYEFVAFDQEEQELYDRIEHGDYRVLSEEEVREIQERLKASEEREAISLRVNGGDLAKLKEKAEKVGMPYQTLINTILHRYVTGEIELKETV